MHPSKWRLILALILMGSILATSSPASAAESATSPNAAAAKVICAPVGSVLPETARAKCTELVAKAWPDNPTTATAAGVCTVMLGSLRVLTPVCVKAVEPVMGKAVTAAQDAVKVAKFVANPEDAFESLANQLKESATSVTETVMTRMNKATTVTVNAEWFRSYYAGAMALGILVMAVMLFLLYREVGAGGLEEEDLGRGLVYAPVAVLAMSFTPIVGQVLSAGATELANGTAAWAAPQTGAFIVEEAGTWSVISAVTMGMIPGGVIVPIFMFAMMLLGSLSVLAGFVTQELGAYLGTLAVGVAWGMYVHPKWRPKLTRLLYFVVSLFLQKAVLWLVLGGVFLVINNAFEIKAGADGFALLVALMGTAVALLIIGLAPWAALKYAPLMPGGNEHKQSGGGHMTEAVMGGVAGGMSSVAMQRAYSMSRSSDSQSTSSTTTSTSKAPNAANQGADTDAGSGSPGGGWRDRGRSTPPGGQQPGTGAGSAGGAAAKGGSAGGAAAGGSAAAGAGAAAASGGVLLPVVAAQTASSALTGAVNKARRVAEDGPQVGGQDV